MVSKINLVAALLFTFVLIGCGGGETATTAAAGGGTDAPSSPGGGGGGNPQPGAGTGTAALNWTPPQTYTDGSTFSDLEGHNVYMDSGNGFVKIASVLTTTSVSSYLVESLSTGSYIFSVTAYDSQGVESSFSSSATITI